MKVRFFALVALLTTIVNPVGVFAQDLLDELQASSPPETQYTHATFKTTRILNGQSVELVKRGDLDFRVSHRFGAINQGYDQFFGLDDGTTFISLEYGIVDQLMVGLSRNQSDRGVVGSLKWSMLRQSRGDKKRALSIAYFTSISRNGYKFSTPHPMTETSRYSYTHQILFARKFNDRFSLQLSPTYIHKNYVTSSAYEHDIVSIGVGSRLKISRRVSFNAEYFPILSSRKYDSFQAFRNALSLGFDIETGGHVFQLILSNSTGMVEKDFITQTFDQWGKGQVHFGFNISRVFSVGQ